MREKELLKQLSALRGVGPDQDFARGLRSRIMYGSEPREAHFFGLAQSLSSTLSISLAVLLFAFIALGGVATVLRHPALPTFQGVNEQSLASEAGSINETIQVHLNEVNYLAGVKEGKLARARLSAEEAVLEGASRDEEIDLLLTQAKDF